MVLLPQSHTRNSLIGPSLYHVILIWDINHAQTKVSTDWQDSQCNGCRNLGRGSYRICQVVGDDHLIVYVEQAVDTTRIVACIRHSHVLCSPLSPRPFVLGDHLCSDVVTISVPFRSNAHTSYTCFLWALQVLADVAWLGRHLLQTFFIQLTKTL